MKKLFFMVAALLTAGVASAQMTYSLGYISTSWDYDYSGGDKTLNGFTLGLDDNVNLAGDLNLSLGVGMEMSFATFEGLLGADWKYKEFGLFVPVDFNYGFAIGNNIKLSVFAGPTFNLGLMSKATHDDNEFNYYDEDDGNSSRFDILMGGGVWLDIQDQFRIKVGYKAGLMDTDKSDNIERKTNILSVSLGYIF